MLCIYIILLFLKLTKALFGIPEDSHLTTPELITKNGYQVETHNITTSDGYILTVYRIPQTNPNKSILINHGTFSTSDNFLVGDKTQSLALLLANKGYDVWLINNRGNRYSRQHTTLSYKDKEFWNFSLHEIGIYDLTATIDYILNLTQVKLFYLGHSQGTTTFYILTTMKPEYNQKIRAHISLAPIAFPEHFSPRLNRISVYFADEIARVFRFLQIHEILPHNRLRAVTVVVFCKNFQRICRRLTEWQMGDSTEFNMTATLILFGQFPAGTSLKLLVHYAQLVKSGNFQQFDYGDRNQQKYKSDQPPKYNLSLITSPGYLFYTKFDNYANYIDVEKLYNNTPSNIKKYLIQDGKFNHADYLTGIHAPEIIYTKILTILNKH